MLWAGVTACNLTPETIGTQGARSVGGKPRIRVHARRFSKTGAIAGLGKHALTVDQTG